MFRAISCLCLPVSSGHLPPPLRATIAALLPSLQTLLRHTGFALPILNPPNLLLCSFFREFAGASLKELSIPLVEDKTGEISRAFGVFDPTTHTAVPTAFVLDEEGEMMASFTTSTQVILVS